MIPRTLVPEKVNPVRNGDEVNQTPRRLTTMLDERTVVPTGPSSAPPLDGKTTIPAHLPLGVLVNRTLVPRGMAVKRLENAAPQSEFAAPIAILDNRTVVPTYVEPATTEEIQQFEHSPEMTANLRDVVEPDIFLTGEANLLVEPEDKRDPKADLITRILSVAVHIGLIIFLIFIPKIFPTHVPTEDEIALASHQLGLTYISPSEIPKPRPPSPKIPINRETLEKVAPPRPQPPVEQPKSMAPAAPAPDLPSAPTPRNLVTPPAPSQPSPPLPSQVEPLRPQPSPNHLDLGLHSESPGKAIQDQMQDAIKGQGRGKIYPGTSIPQGAGSGRGPGMGFGPEILSDTQGVDFNSYIQRLLVTLKRNWEAVMPESARMGDQGLVYTTFQINPDGSVQSPDPTLERTSGKVALDGAAMSAIHASNPFEPLPPQFHGPYLRLRIVFLYNLPLDYMNKQ